MKQNIKKKSVCDCLFRFKVLLHLIMVIYTQPDGAREAAVELTLGTELSTSSNANAPLQGHFQWTQNIGFHGERQLAAFHLQLFPPETSDVCRTRTFPSEDRGKHMFGCIKAQEGPRLGDARQDDKIKRFSIEMFGCSCLNPAGAVGGGE